MTPYRCAILSCVLALALPLAALAQESPNRKEIKRVDLSGAPGMEVVTSLNEYKPGDLIPVHFHHGVEAYYVIQGAMVQLPGKEPTLLPTGATPMNLRDAVHGGSTVVGDTSLKFFAVHIVDKGKPLFDTPPK